jgi:DNA-binding NtrC family response regulator
MVDRVGGRAPVPIDVRVIAATNRNLETCMREKQFREDLYYRLSVVRIQTPSLREVPEDIPTLANHFLQKHCAAMAMEPKRFAQPALECLAAYSWPGNARQLENEVKRLVASTRGKIIGEDHISTQPSPPAEPQASVKLQPRKSLFDAVDALERRMIEEALRDTAGNKLKAAQSLGVSRQGLLKKLKKLGLSAR